MPSRVDGTGAPALSSAIDSHSGCSRREILRYGATAAAVTVAGKGAAGANERIRLGLIGARAQGRHVALQAIEAGARIATLCDVDDAINARVNPELAKAQGSPAAYVKDYRRVLDDKEIDAVIIAAPDHWHTHMALLACQAGKDVYVEKPLSQTIEEGLLIRNAARKYDRVVQVGTHRRSGEHFRSAAEYVASGKLGKVCVIKAWICQVRESIGNPPDAPAPAGVDYDAWLGPAPKRGFNPNRFHYNWRFFWDYGNSELGNQGIHMLDVGLWAIEKMHGLEYCVPKRVSSTAGIYWLNDAKQVPDTQVVTFSYDDLILVWEMHSFQNHHLLEGDRAATAFYGTEGTLIVGNQGWSVTNKDGSRGPEAKTSGVFHARNFLECMRSRKRPNADIETGRVSTTLCHLGNISHHLGREVRFDAKSQTFGSDAEANKLLKKSSYRIPLPRV